MTLNVCAAQPSLLIAQPLMTASAPMSRSFHPGIQCGQGESSMVTGLRPAARSGGEEGYGEDGFFPCPPFRQDSFPRMSAPSCFQNSCYGHICPSGVSRPLYSSSPLLVHFWTFPDALNRERGRMISLILQTLNDPQQDRNSAYHTPQATYQP